MFTINNREAFLLFPIFNIGNYLQLASEISEQMTPLTVAKFGGSALGLEGAMIPQIVDRIKKLQQESKVVTVFSAPLIEYNS